MLSTNKVFLEGLNSVKIKDTNIENFNLYAYINRYLENVIFQESLLFLKAKTKNHPSLKTNYRFTSSCESHTSISDRRLLKALTCKSITFVQDIVYPRHESLGRSNQRKQISTERSMLHKAEQIVLLFFSSFLPTSKRRRNKVPYQ